MPLSEPGFPRRLCLLKCDHLGSEGKTALLIGLCLGLNLFWTPLRKQSGRHFEKKKMIIPGLSGGLNEDIQRDNVCLE